LKPRTPADCPMCRRAGATAAEHPPTRIPVTPWRERKSRRGAPKRIATQGFACPNRTCLYVGIVIGNWFVLWVGEELKALGHQRG
ncbi:MAG TPA: hypothetical protein VFS61_14190, partial [Anaerolineales bacterium]|nr:hypothetical protein [Anaerolineales bacterium]